jgi:hypothetical protein
MISKINVEQITSIDVYKELINKYWYYEKESLFSLSNLFFFTPNDIYNYFFKNKKVCLPERYMYTLWDSWNKIEDRNDLKVSEGKAVNKAKCIFNLSDNNSYTYYFDTEEEQQKFLNQELLKDIKFIEYKS